MVNSHTFYSNKYVNFGKIFLEFTIVINSCKIQIQSLKRLFSNNKKIVILTI